jgi:hypothetical protein
VPLDLCLCPLGVQVIQVIQVVHGGPCMDLALLTKRENWEGPQGEFLIIGAKGCEAHCWGHLGAPGLKDCHLFVQHLPSSHSFELLMILYLLLLQL